MGQEKIACLVCGYFTLSRRGGYEICPICFWEDEGEIGDPAKPTYGPNDSLSLTQARRNYKKLGAVDAQLVSKVRPPTAEEMGDSS
jgi:hypothetical protein